MYEYYCNNKAYFNEFLAMREYLKKHIYHLKLIYFYAKKHILKGYENISIKNSKTIYDTLLKYTVCARILYYAVRTSRMYSYVLYISIKCLTLIRPVRYSPGCNFVYLT